MSRYSEMRNAAEQRGTYMDQLNDQLNAASVSASNYLQQARNQAVSVLLTGARASGRLERVMECS